MKVNDAATDKKICTMITPFEIIKKHELFQTQQYQTKLTSTNTKLGKDVLTCQGANADSDHFLVIAKKEK